MTEQISAAALASLQETVAAWWAAQAVDVPPEQAEVVAQAVGRTVAAQVLAQCWQQSSGRASYQGTRRPCACGGRARFVQYRERWLRTLCGEQRVARAYYHCAACGAGQCPWDAPLGLNERGFTPAVKALVAECCARLTHREVEGLLQRLLGWSVEESTQQALVGELGGRLRVAAAAARAACFDHLELPPARLAPPVTPGGRLYVSLDAAKAHVDGSWHDVKCAALYVGEPTARGDRGGKPHYVACQERAAAFGEQVYVAAHQVGLAQAGEVAVLGDGAEWIWGIAGMHFTGATQILDYWHACEHIWALVPVLYGEGSPAGQRWAEIRCADLEAHGPAGLLRALRRRVCHTAAQREAVRLAVGYFTTHRPRMNYPAYRARGLMIGSGPVEAACKVVVGQRLKGAGMRWSAAGADAMLAVRTTVLNGDYDRLAQYARAC